MQKYRRTIMWLGLLLIIILAVLSIYGAFIGAERGQQFFNQPPLVVYWITLVLLLIIGIAAFRRLLRVPGLLLIHAGCVLIIAGGMWSSQGGHNLQKKLFGIDKIRTGRMTIYEGSSENQVALSGTREQKELPFSLKLNDFRIEYYQPAYLQIETTDGNIQRITAELGQQIDLGPEYGQAEIVRMFENFKMSIEDGKTIAFEDTRPGLNPALAVRITPPSGEATTHHVFSLHPGFGHTQGGPKMIYERPPYRAISDYISELEVIDNDGNTVARKDIEVNHPLHYGGYHFYQYNYDHQASQYTVLEVVSDTGLYVVYAGYWMLCIGVIWHMWLRHIFSRLKAKST